MWISSVRDGPNPSQSIQDVNKDPKITELVCNESALLQISKLFTCPHITMSLVSTMSQAVVDSGWLVLEAEKEKFDDIKKV